MMKRFLFCLALAVSFASATPPTSGQYEIRKRRSDGFYDSIGVSLADGQVIGQSGGTAAAITPFSGLYSDLSGTPAVSLGGNASLDAGKLPQFDSNGELTAAMFNADAGGGALAELFPDRLNFSSNGNTYTLRPAEGILSTSARFYLPILSGDFNLITTGDSGTVTNTMLASSSMSIAGNVVPLGGGISSSAILDSFTTTQGSILYRNGAGVWAALTPGTSGQFLKTNGAGANPTWGTVSSGITIGTTTISGGTSGRILYNNAGVVGELALGTGVSTALGNAVNAASGLLTYGIIGTSGASVPLLNAANTFSGVNTFSAAQTFSASSAASTPSVRLSGSVFSGGTGTTTMPHFLIMPSGATASTSWDTNGTMIGIKMASGFAGTWLDIKYSNDVSIFKIANAGDVSANSFSAGVNIVAGGGSYLGWNGTTLLSAPANGSVKILTSSGTNNVVLSPRADNNLGLGLPSATPTAQQIGGQSGSGSNITGGDLNIGTKGTGTGTSGSINLQTHAAGSSGSTAGTLVTMVSVTPSGVSLGNGATVHSKVKSGVATLTAGTVTISDSDVKETGTAATTSRIFISRMTDGGTVGDSYSITRVNGTSFTITSMLNGMAQTLETSTVAWMLINP